MRLLIIIFDGIADRPLKELGDKTPLEEASTPNMDCVAKESVCGLMDPIAPGIRPGSDTAHLALLGYDPMLYYTGRGPFEAVGSGVEVREGDVAFRCNFATVDENMMLIDRRAGRVADGLGRLAEILNDMKLRAVPGVKVTFKWLGAHRAILVLRGPNLSSRVSDIDPRTTGIKVPESKPLQLVMEAKRTADAINEVVSRSYEAFSLHEVNRMRVKEGKPPANIILPRGAGEPPKMETVRDKYGFESAACVAEVPLVRGVCTYAGMKVVQPRGLKGDPTTDLESVRRAILRLVKENEFVLLNVKGFDVLSHDGDVEGKVRFIERVDGMIGRLWESLDRDEVCLVLTSDHATPIYVRDHSGDPVPLAVATSAARVDEVSAFDERAVSKGGLGRIRGLDLMPILLDLIGKSKKFGA